MTRVVVIGAGASRGTVGFPGVAEFGRELAALHGDWRARWPALATAVDQTNRAGAPADAWRLDELWTRVDYIAKLHPALGIAPYDGRVSTELHAAIAAVYGRVLWDGRIAGDRTERSLPWLLSRVKAGDSVVSFNWDTLAEQIIVQQLRSAGIRLVQTPHPETGASVRFSKPHGSLAWPCELAGAVADVNGYPRLTTVTAEEVMNNLRKQPLLLGAVPMKSELMKEVQGAANEWIYRTIMSQWRALCEAITYADAIDVAGYSFPDEDSHGRLLFQEACRRRKAAWVETTLFVPEGKDGDEAARRMERALLLEAGTIKPAGKVVPPATAAG